MLIAIIPAITAGAYHANDCIGGKMTLARAVLKAYGESILYSLTIQDKAQQNAAMRIFLFQADPALGTYADNAALDIHDTDLLDCIGVLEVSTTDYVSAADNSMACLSNFGLPIQAKIGTTIYALAMVTGTPTYASVSDLTFIFGLARY